MPIYEYECPKCGQFEVTQRITEDALKKCPTCKSKVRKLISNTSFQLKGSGWYATDYAKKGTTTESKESGKDGAASGGADAKSSESKSKDKAADSKSEPAKASKKDTTAHAA
jgi:putative FmdB family regulatory protein